MAALPEGAAQSVLTGTSPPPLSGATRMLRGSVALRCWKVETGENRFAGAQGLNMRVAAFVLDEGRSLAPGLLELKLSAASFAAVSASRCAPSTMCSDTISSTCSVPVRVR